MKTCPMKTRIFHANVLKMCVLVEVSLKFDVGFSLNFFPGCISSQYQVATKDPAWGDFPSQELTGSYLYPLEGKVHFDASKYKGLFYGYLRWFPEEKWRSFLLFSNSLWMDLFWLVATQICYVFIPILGVSWSNLTKAHIFQMDGWKTTQLVFVLGYFSKIVQIFCWGFGMRFERREILLFGIAQAQRCVFRHCFWVKPFVESLLERREGMDFAPFFFSEKWKSSVVPGCQNCLKM